MADGAAGAPFHLYYWPSIQGRGEFVRLALEAGGARYHDLARMPTSEGGGVPALMAVLEGKAGGPGSALPFAPPILVHEGLTIAQTSNILQYLGPRLGLVPDDEPARVTANQYQLTIGDLLVEAHDVHHPIGAALYYEDQIPESKRRAELFVSKRLPKFLSYFERVLARGAPGAAVAHAVGQRLSYVDLSLFQVMSGLAYAFPRAMEQLEPSVPHLCALRAAVAAHPPVKAYLGSERRLPFNQHGIFRHYPELDT